MTTTNRHLRFLNSVEVSASVRASSFDPAALLSGRLTVYLCLPPEHLKTQAPLMRLWITCLLNVVVRGGLSKDRMVRFLLDEAASLSRLEILDDALDKLRGYGVRLILIYQALSQIKKCFPDGQDQTVLANSSLVAFGTADLETAKGLSERIGDETVVVESGGSSGGTSFQRPSGPGHGSMTTSSNTSSNWGQQARRLLKPEEILSMDGREALFFTPGVPPGIVRLVRYFEEPCLTSRPGRLSRLSRACLYLAGSALALFLTSFVLVGLLVALHLRDAPPDPPQVFAPAVAPVRPFVAPQNRFRQQRR
jgi:type IV secretion system protein VirD4